MTPWSRSSSCSFRLRAVGKSSSSIPVLLGHLGESFNADSRYSMAAAVNSSGERSRSPAPFFSRTLWARSIALASTFPFSSAAAISFFSLASSAFKILGSTTAFFFGSKAGVAFFEAALFLGAFFGALAVASFPSSSSDKPTEMPSAACVVYLRR